MPYDATVVKLSHPLCSRNGPEHLNCYNKGCQLTRGRLNPWPFVVWDGTFALLLSFCFSLRIIRINSVPGLRCLKKEAAHSRPEVE